MPIQFTRKGRYEVWRDGQKISEHNQEREATEQIINHSSVYGDGDYEIKGYLVVARVVGSVNPQTGDTTPPTTPGSVSASATSATTGTVTWTASTDASGVAGYQIFLDGAPLSPTTTNPSYSLTGLSPSTQYAVTVVAFDAAGNNSVAGGPALFTTNANSAPVWSLGNQAYETGASVSISLDTVCTDADGDTINYSLVSGSLPSGLSLSGARNETLSGTVDTVETAVFTLGASDGIASVQNVALTFTITAPDTVAPAAPTGLTVVSTTSSSINLDWADNAESDLASYDVYRSTVGAGGPWGKRNGTPLTSSAYQDSGLNEQTQYWYYVTATDDSGNESVASSVVNSTTPAASAPPYDLSSYTVPFAYSWPSPPVTSQTINVPGDMTIAAAAATNGAIINVTSGDYGDVSPGNDQEWILSPGVTLDTFNYTGSQRVKLTCSTPRTATVRRVTADESGGTTRDFLCDGVNLASDSGQVFPESLWSSPNGQRVAIVNCNIQSNSYAIFPVTANENWSNNLIIAGNYIYTSSSLPPGTYGNQHGIRAMSINTFIIADNYIEKDDSGMALRLHTNQGTAPDCYDGFVAGNTIAIGPNPGFAIGMAIQPASAAYTPQNMLRIIVESNEIHNEGGGCIALQDENAAFYSNCQFNNNNAYGSLGLPGDLSAYSSTQSGNTQSAYNSANIPSAASVLGWTP